MIASFKTAVARLRLFYTEIKIYMVSSLLSVSTDDVLTVINSLFFILGGIAVFMVGMNMMGSNLENAAGRSMRKLMTKATKNRFIGVGTGAAVTAIVNSSSATTVMIVGFVNVGLMTLTQAASVIMGANIGTTISAFIMALSTAGGAFSVAAVFALVALVGFVITLVAKKDKIKRIGYIFIGLGLIFVGLDVMSGAVKALTEGNVGEGVKKMFIALGNGDKPLTWEIIVLFLLGAALTAAMQSSGALTAIVISLAGGGLISLQMAMCIILGTNVGTCVTSLISSVGASVNARRAAMVHLLFNIVGCFIFIWPVAFAGKYIAQFLNSVIKSTQWQIAIFHMVFNLLTTALLLPFVNYLVKLACLIVKDKKGAEASAEEYERLDKRLLKTPAIAVGQVRKELLHMGGMAFENYKRALDMLISGDISQKPDFEATEKSINDYNSFISSFLVKLSLEELAETDEKKVSSFYHVASDIERIGDYAENIVEYAERMIIDKAQFSEHAKAEILEMDKHVTELYKWVEKTFGEIDMKYLPSVEAEEQATDDACKMMQDAHLRRMTEGHCTAEAGAVYLQLALNMERIGDHMNNIAQSVRGYAHH